MKKETSKKLKSRKNYKKISKKKKKVFAKGMFRRVTWSSNVGDGCYRQFMLVADLKCWLHIDMTGFQHFVSFNISFRYEQILNVTNIMILSPKLLCRHQNLVFTKIIWARDQRTTYSVPLTSRSSGFLLVLMYSVL